jgi:hypothetical protein
MIKYVWPPDGGAYNYYAEAALFVTALGSAGVDPAVRRDLQLDLRERGRRRACNHRRSVCWIEFRAMTRADQKALT